MACQFVGKTERALRKCCIEHPQSDKNAIWTDACEGIKHIKNFISRYTSSDAGITTSNIYHCDINIRTVKNNV